MDTVVVWLYIAMFTPSAGEPVRQIVVFETKEECVEANDAYTQWLIKNGYDPEQFGIPESACIKLLSV